MRVSLLPFLQGGTYAILTAAAGGEGAPAGGRLAAGGSKGTAVPGSPQCGPTNAEPQTDASRYEGMLSPLHALTLSADKRAQAPPSHPNPNPNPNPNPSPSPSPSPLHALTLSADKRAQAPPSHPHPHPHPNPSPSPSPSPSPLHALTLSADKRAQARIPAGAMYYCFVYPLRDSERSSLAEESTIAPQALDLARYGGYAYFNDGLAHDTHDDADAWGARASPNPNPNPKPKPNPTLTLSLTPSLTLSLSLTLTLTLTRCEGEGEGRGRAVEPGAASD